MEETKSELLHFRVTPTLLAKLQRYAEAHGKPLSGAVVEFLEESAPLLGALTKVADARARNRARAIERMTAKAARAATR